MTSSHDLAIQAGVYRSYVVRFWQSSFGGPLRISVQHVQNGETLRFADLNSLFAYLQAQAANDDNSTAGEGDTGG
jgi:hypothetical protein